MNDEQRVRGTIKETDSEPATVEGVESEPAAVDDADPEGTAVVGADPEPDAAGVVGRRLAATVPAGAARQAEPATCPDCNSPIPHGVHFCPSCRVFLPNPWVGELATSKRRLAAAMLDGVFKDGGIFGFALWNAILPPGVAGSVIRILSLAYGVSALVLWTRGTTPAKRLLGMNVITEDGEHADFWRMAGRETIGKWISMMVFGLGLLAVPFDKEHRGWHDRMFGTWVVHDEED